MKQEKCRNSIGKNTDEADSASSARFLNTLAWIFEELEIPYVEGLFKSKYVGRTFIEPDQSSRERTLKLKLTTLWRNVKDKKVVLVDDSIVRGNTSKKIVSALKRAGAKEVHVRISSPPIIYSCYYGIDTPDRKQLLAATKSIEEIKEFICADSLAYLSLDN